ncbi:MAG TPA: divalent metal cation transporter, partial [Dissulfurispiraceae bacterium]
MRENIKKAFRFLGPGFIAGAADDDPSALGSYSQTGAQLGYQQLWTALFSLPFLIAVQEMAGRIGMSTGKGLARIIKEHYPRALLYTAVFLLTAGNVVFIGADLGAMASSAQLLVPIPFTAWLVIMAVLILALEIFSTYIVYSKVLKYLALSLSAYFFTAFAITQDWGRIIHATLIPHFSADRDFLLNVAAIIGTRASPYIFFWQPSQEVEEEIAQRKIGGPGGNEPPAIDRGDVKRMRANT